MSNYSKDLVYKTVARDDLEQHTQDGWQLIDMLNEVSQSAVENRRDVWHTDQYNSTQQGQEVKWEFGVPTNNYIFLIGRPRGEYDQVQSLQSRIIAHQETAERKDQEITDLKNTLHEERKKADDTKNSTDATEAELREKLRLAIEEKAGSMEELTGLRETVRKIREHFGDREMKAALAIKSLEESKAS